MVSTGLMQKLEREKAQKKYAAELLEEDIAKAERDRKQTESKQETEDLLDEIDSVLIENAAEMVKQYVQKGGE